MFGKTIWLPKCQVTNSTWEDLILLHFYLHMLNDINVKNSWDSVRCKYQLKQIAKTRKKNVTTNENCILRKIGLKFQNPSVNILCKIAFCNKSGWIRSWLYGAGCPGKKTACLVREPWKIINFICKKILISWNRASLHSPSPASSVSMLAHFNKMPIQLGQPIKGDRMLF